MVVVQTFAMPDLGEGLEDGEIVEWLVTAGDRVQVNDELVEIETAKAVVRVPSPFAGVVVETFGARSEVIAVGSPLCRIEVDGSDQAASAPPAPAGGDVATPKPLVGYGDTSEQDGVLARRRPLAKPPIRKLAKDLGVALESLAPGSGPGGAVTREDVHAATSRRETGPRAATAAGTRVPGFRGRHPGEIEPVTGIRKRIVEKMEVSRRSIPHAGCARDVDLTELWERRHDLSEAARDVGANVSINPFALICRATILGLRRFPTLNSRYDAEAAEIRLLEHINLGIAVDTDRGLLVPNVKSADTLSTIELAAEIDRLANACRDGSVTPGELTGGTFTVDNYGYFGNDDGDMIINAPESGILGVGAIRQRPWVHDGEVAVRMVSRLALAFDHRVADGGEAGRFVTYVGTLAEDPLRMLLHL